MKIHPDDLLLTELAATLQSEQIKQLVHLLGCTSCRARLLALLEEAPQGSSNASKATLVWSSEEDYGPAFTAVSRNHEPRIFSLMHERAEAPGFFHQLIAQPRERRFLLLENSRRLHTWGLLELLVDRAMKARAGEPESGEELGHLALFLASKLNVDFYGAERLADMKARAWGGIANHRRIHFDLRGAEIAMASGFSQLREGTGDLIERAILLDLKASLLRALRRFDQAVRLLDRAYSIFVEYGDSHRAGRTLSNQAIVQIYAGRPEPAIFLLHRAIELVDPDREPYVVFSIWHNLALALVEMGRFTEARNLLGRAAPIYGRFRSVVPQSHRKWVEGRIALGLGDEGEAETHLLCARDAFHDVGMDYNVALISLELALLYARQDRVTELESLAMVLFRTFAAHGIQREALAALCLRASPIVKQAS